MKSQQVNRVIILLKLVRTMRLGESVQADIVIKF